MGGIFSVEKPNKQVPMQTRVLAVVQSPNIPLLSYNKPEVRAFNKPISPSISPPSNHKEQRKRGQYGHFECTTCRKKWQSSHSWEGKRQKCTRCNTYVLPTNLQDIQPTYECTYKCMNTKCKNTYIKCGILDSKELNQVLETHQEIVCNNNKNKQVFKSKPSEVNICYHPTYEVESSVYCKSCGQKHRMNIACLDDETILHGFKRQCTICNHMSSRIIKIKKLQSDLSKPHKRELCEKCQEVGGYCGR